jgi:hypothetical protein
MLTDEQTEKMIKSISNRSPFTVYDEDAASGEFTNKLLDEAIDKTYFKIRTTGECPNYLILPVGLTPPKHCPNFINITYYNMLKYYDQLSEYMADNIKSPFAWNDDNIIHKKDKYLAFLISGMIIKEDLTVHYIVPLSF